MARWTRGTDPNSHGSKALVNVDNAQAVVNIGGKAVAVFGPTHGFDLNESFESFERRMRTRSDIDYRALVEAVISATTMRVGGVPLRDIPAAVLDDLARLMQENFD